MKTNLVELQITKIHLSKKKEVNIANIYIPPRDTSRTLDTEDQEITQCLTHTTGMPNTIITGDLNAHSKTWFNNTDDDHRGELVAKIISSSEQIILNTNTHTRIPKFNQQPTSPDVTTISSNMQTHTTWNTLPALNSDHLPIMITIKTKSNYRLIQNRRTFTNYNKANWEKYRDEIEEEIAKTERHPTNVHTANSFLTNCILTADKRNIPKGKIKNNAKNFLPAHITDKITERDNIRRQNPHDPRLQDINNDISTQIQTHKADIWKNKLEQNWDHKTNTHVLWKTIHNLENKKPPQQLNRTIQFNNKTETTAQEIATAFNKQFTNVIKHTSKKNNRKIDNHTKKLESTHTDITMEQTKAAIQKSKNNNSTGPDDINIKHLKHLGPLALQYMTDIFNLSLQQNKIPSIWKLAKIIPIPKPQKDLGVGSSYRPISLLSPIAKTLEKIILPQITKNIPEKLNQHGFKAKHSTTTALHRIHNTITNGFNQKRPPSRTIVVALDMSKAFDTVDLHILIQKLQHTNIPANIIKFVANYIKGRKAYTLYNGVKSKQRHLKTGVPQGGVLSPTLFNIYMADMPSPPPGVQNESYADDINSLTSHPKIEIAEQAIQPYLNSLFAWTQENNLILNADKSTATLFTPDPAEYKTQLKLTINNTLIPTVRNPKILGLTFDPQLTFAEHIKNTQTKANKTLNIIKSLTSTKWGKQKETLVTTYKAITRPLLEYASTIWSPSTADTHINKLQVIQNSALRTATGCTADTNIQHLHEEALILPIDIHLKLHASQYRQKSQHPTHPLHDLTLQPPPQRLQKQTIYHNQDYTINIETDPLTVNETEIKQNMKTIHSTIVQTYNQKKHINKVINMLAPPINSSECTLPRPTRRTLAQLRTGKSPILQTYLHKIDPKTHTTPNCPLCHTSLHTTEHLFDCTKLRTSLKPIDLWTNPSGASSLLARWDLIRRTWDPGGGGQ
jgi:hypothetical protein